MQAKSLCVLWKLAFAALALGCVWPVFYARYPPIQDLPQHLAAVRVLHDFANPEFGFQRFFELSLLDTQYLSYYLAAHGLAYVFDVELANKLLIAASMLGIAHATRSVLQGLGKDGRLSLLALPLSYNAHLILGFLNFTAAIPLSLYGVALALRLRRRYSLPAAVGLGLLALCCFYTHVVPFAIMLIGVVLVSLQRDVRAMVRGLAPLLPSAVCALLWLRVSPAGQATVTAAGGTARDAVQFTPFEQALEEIPRWLTDVFAGANDLRLLAGWTALIGLCWLLGAIERALGRGQSAPDALARSLGNRLLVLPPLCALLYFTMPTAYAWIWPIAQRFPLLCAIWLVATLPRGRMGRELILVLALVASAASFHQAGKAFASFEREEVGDFDQALAVLPKAQRVVGLIFDRHSRHAAFAPFIHYVAYYQARKGGAVMFTFADFPQSPFHFIAGNRPPRVPPRWEWLPQRVRPVELAFYDYALVRGGPGLIARAHSGFASVYRGARWSVWRNLR